jgi:uncharacterized protein YfkK (UPF0435 family)
MITMQKVYPTEFLFGNAELAVDKMQVVNKGVLYPQESQRIILTNINKIYADIKSRQTEFSSITDDNGRKQFQEQKIILTQTQTPRNIKDHLNKLKNYILKLYTNNEIKLTYEELADSMENIQKLLEIFYPAKEVLVDDSEYITKNTDLPLVSLKTRKGGRRTHRKQKKQKKQKKTQKMHKKRTNKRKQKKCKKKTIKR